MPCDAGGVQRSDDLIDLTLLDGLVLGGGSGWDPGEYVSLQPVADREGRTNVVLVVASDRVELRPVTALHPALVADDRTGARVDLVTALVAGDELDLLEAVRLGADAYGAPDDLKEVDEDALVNERSERVGA